MFFLTIIKRKHLFILSGHKCTIVRETVYENNNAWLGAAAT